MKNYDIVTKPKHYNDRKIEVIDFIEDTVNSNKVLDNITLYNIASSLKYIPRAGMKFYDGKTAVQSAIIDLKKAQFHLARAIENLEKVDMKHKELALNAAHHSKGFIGIDEKEVKKTPHSTR